MDLKYITKVLQDKEKTQTKSDTTYQTNKVKLDQKEKEVNSIEVGQKIYRSTQRIIHNFLYLFLIFYINKTECLYACFCIIFLFSVVRIAKIKRNRLRRWNARSIGKTAYNPKQRMSSNGARTKSQGWSSF